VAWFDCNCATPGAHPDATRVLLRDVGAHNTTAVPHYTSHRHMFHLNMARLLLGYGVDVKASINGGLWLHAGLCAFEYVVDIREVDGLVTRMA
jgi:hypothetical protein